MQFGKRESAIPLGGDYGLVGRALLQSEAARQVEPFGFETHAGAARELDAERVRAAVPIESFGHALEGLVRRRPAARSSCAQAAGSNRGLNLQNDQLPWVLRFFQS